MSNSGDDQNQSGQGGQPQGGQPQGGQGGQPPQGGQPQGQPQGGQPQGGQPPQGQPRGQPQQQGTSVDIPPEVQEWSIYGAIVFAIAGGLSGLYGLLFSALESPVVEPDFSAGAGTTAQSVASAAFGIQVVAGILPIFLATFVGIALYSRLQMNDNTLLKTAGAFGGVGTLVAFVLICLLAFITSSNVSLEFGGLLINGIVAALLGGGACAGGVWAEQNQAPDRTP